MSCRDLTPAVYMYFGYLKRFSSDVILIILLIGYTTLRRLPRHTGGDLHVGTETSIYQVQTGVVGGTVDTSRS